MCVHVCVCVHGVCMYVCVDVCVCLCMCVHEDMVCHGTVHGWRVPCQEWTQTRWRMTQEQYGGHSTNCRKGSQTVLTHCRWPPRQVCSMLGAVFGKDIITTITTPSPTNSPDTTSLHFPHLTNIGQDPCRRLQTTPPTCVRSV